jgi:trans-aconitate methyltransferase
MSPGSPPRAESTFSWNTRPWLRTFAYPVGWRGAIAGWFLARFNAELNRRAVARLPDGPAATVLEIGSGPGVGLRLLAERYPAGAIHGLDPSPTMLGQAWRRNRRAVEAGRVTLHRGTTDQMRWSGPGFDGILSVNSILFWIPWGPSLQALVRVLRPSGTVVVGLHEWAARAAPESIGRSLSSVASFLVTEFRRVGLGASETEVVPASIGRALLLVARRAPGGAV